MLELLIVMAIMAGLIAVALPQFANLFARVRASYERSDIEQQILQLPQLVRSSGRDGVLFDPAAPPAKAEEGAADRSERLSIDLPSGWTMRLPKPLYYHFTGACSGGEIDLSLPPARFRYILTAPLCRPMLANAHAQ